MANIKEFDNPGFPNIHQWKLKDLVKGGEDGVATLPIKQLTERTEYLKKKLENLQSPGISPEVPTPPMPDDKEIDLSHLEAQIALKADIASPSFSGSPRGPTPSHNDNSDRLATTAFVQSKLGQSNVSVNTTSLIAPSNAGANRDNVHPFWINVNMATPNIVDCFVLSKLRVLPFYYAIIFDITGIWNGAKKEILLDFSRVSFSADYLCLISDYNIVHNQYRAAGFEDSSTQPLSHLCQYMENRKTLANRNRWRDTSNVLLNTQNYWAFRFSNPDMLVKVSFEYLLSNAKYVSFRHGHTLHRAS